MSEFRRSPVQPVDELLKHVTTGGPRYIAVHFDDTGVVQRAYGTPTGRMFRSLSEATRFVKTATRRAHGFMVLLEIQEYSTHRWHELRND